MDTTASEDHTVDHGTQIPAWVVPAGFMVSIVGIAVVVILATIIESPTNTQYSVFRTVLALTGMVFSLSGGRLLTMRINLPWGSRIIAGGSFFVFIILYFCAPNLGMPDPKVEQKKARAEFDTARQRAIDSCSQALDLSLKSKSNLNESRDKLREAVDECQQQKENLDAAGDALNRWSNDRERIQINRQLVKVDIQFAQLFPSPDCFSCLDIYRNYKLLVPPPPVDPGSQVPVGHPRL